MTTIIKTTEPRTYTEEEVDVLRVGYDAALKREGKLVALLKYMADTFRKQADYIEGEINGR